MNILLVTHRFPFPPDKGDRIRSWRLLQALSSVGEVRLATGAAEPVAPEHLDAVRNATAALHVAPLGRLKWPRAALRLATGGSLSEGLFDAPGMRRAIRSWQAERPFDVAVAFCSSVAPMLDEIPNVPTLVDLVDVDSEKFRQYAEGARGPKRWAFALEARRVRALERRAAARAGTTVLCTQPEAALFRGIAPEARIEAIPNGVDGVAFSRGDPQRKKSQRRRFRGNACANTAGVVNTSSICSSSVESSAAPSESPAPRTSMRMSREKEASRRRNRSNEGSSH